MVGTGMTITCARDELVAKLGIVSRAVSTRGSVQVLSGILVRAEAGALELAATDMELTAACRVRLRQVCDCLPFCDCSPTRQR